MRGIIMGDCHARESKNKYYMYGPRNGGRRKEGHRGERELEREQGRVGGIAIRNCPFPLPSTCKGRCEIDDSHDRSANLKTKKQGLELFEASNPTLTYFCTCAPAVQKCFFESSKKSKFKFSALGRILLPPPPPFSPAYLRGLPFLPSLPFAPLKGNLSRCEPRDRGWKERMEEERGEIKKEEEEKEEGQKSSAKFPYQRRKRKGRMKKDGG